MNNFSLLSPQQIKTVKLVRKLENDGVFTSKAADYFIASLVAEAYSKFYKKTVDFHIGQFLKPFKQIEYLESINAFQYERCNTAETTR